MSSFYVVDCSSQHWAKNKISKLWKCFEMYGNFMEICNFMAFPFLWKYKIFKISKALYVTFSKFENILKCHISKY